MDPRDIARVLDQGRDSLAAFRIRSLHVFGSVARGEDRPGSDVDLLVEFEPDAEIGLLAFCRLQRQLSEMLGRRVDLVTSEALHKTMREGILREAVRAA